MRGATFKNDKNTCTGLKFLWDFWWNAINNLSICKRFCYLKTNIVFQGVVVVVYYYFSLIIKTSLSLRSLEESMKSVFYFKTSHDLKSIFLFLQLTSLDITELIDSK